MALTDNAIKALQLQEKSYKVSDKDGLYMLITKTGKYFRYDYKYQCKRKTIAFGVYPKTSLKEARAKLIDAKLKLQVGIDPNKKEINKSINMFQNISIEWFDKQKNIWVEGHSKRILRRLEYYIFPIIGQKEISSIEAPEILKLLQSIENRGTIETAHRIKQIIGQIFRYAIAIGKATRNPASDLNGALTPVKPQNMATITNPKEIVALLRAIDGYQGFAVVKYALQFLPLVFVRSSELRHAEWNEIDFDNNLWKIPADRMKMGRVHIVPLSKQAIYILNKLKDLTGNGRYLFPSIRTTVRPISENTVNAALRRLGYTKEEMTGHGFRAMASTLLHENGFQSHLIEMQLAHAESNKVKAAYNHAQYLKERVAMMQWWSDYLDSLRQTHNL